MANFIWRLSGRFHTLIWKLRDTVQNLESPGPSCSKLGYNPGLVLDLNSELKA